MAVWFAPWCVAWVALSALTQGACIVYAWHVSVRCGCSRHDIHTFQHLIIGFHCTIQEVISTKGGRHALLRMCVQHVLQSPVPA